MSYGLNTLIHNTSWVTAHFHLIFGGVVVIMYFAIAYDIWPRLTGRDAPSIAAQRAQLWLWFIGMMVMSLRFRERRGGRAHAAGLRMADRAVLL